jgi:hypothetical protein
LLLQYPSLLYQAWKRWVQLGSTSV